MTIDPSIELQNQLWILIHRARHSDVSIDETVANILDVLQPKHPVIPMREMCQMCHRVSPVGFDVPDDIWQEVVHPHWQNSIICLACFIARADEKLVAWDRDIKLYPVSLASQLKIIRETEASKEAPT